MFSLAGEICFYSHCNMSSTEKIALHDLLTILNECVNAYVSRIMFQLIDFHYWENSPIETNRDITNFGTASGNISIKGKTVFQLNKICSSQLKY